MTEKTCGSLEALEPTPKTRRKRTPKGFVDCVIGGERVLVYQPKAPREKSVEIAIRVALCADGVWCQKHHVDNRGKARTGLGIGVSDLICIVPPKGILVCIEVKRPGYSPSDVSEVQRRWLGMVRRFGAVAGIASSVEEARALIAEARSR